MTATGQQFGELKTRTVKIASNLFGKEGYLVNLTTTDETVAIAADATKFPFVLVDGADGSTTVATGAIAVGGRVKVVLGGTVAAGDALTSDGNGKAVTSSTNHDCFGLIALHAGVAGDIIEALIAQGKMSA